MNTISDTTLNDVQQESIRAAAKHPDLHLLTNATMPRGEKLAALVEEVGEVAKELTYDHGDRRRLAKELLQVANLAAAWYQCEAEQFPSGRMRLDPNWGDMRLPGE